MNTLRAVVFTLGIVFALYLIIRLDAWLCRAGIPTASPLACRVIR